MRPCASAPLHVIRRHPRWSMNFLGSELISDSSRNLRQNLALINRLRPGFRFPFRGPSPNQRWVLLPPFLKNFILNTKVMLMSP